MYKCDPDLARSRLWVTIVAVSITLTSFTGAQIQTASAASVTRITRLHTTRKSYEDI